MGAGATYATRIGRHAAIYAGAGALTLAFGFLNVAVFTRYLAPSEFGQVAVFLIFSSMLSVVYNLGSLQGAIRVAFGAGDDEDGVGNLSDDAGDHHVADKRRALGTAIVFTALVGLIGTIVIAAFAPTVSRLLIGTRSEADVVVAAAIAGALGAVWRLVSNVLRVERRPLAWGLTHNARPALAIAAAVPLVATGHGARGVIEGFAIGTALALCFGLYMTRASYRPALSRRDAVAVVRLGSTMIPVVLAIWIMQNADLLILSKYASAADTGLYRVASRIGSGVLYFTSAFYMAWGPMTREPIHAAVEQEQGAAVLGARMASYFALMSMFLIVGLAAFGPVLVHLAAAKYSNAAGLIPLIGIGGVAYGVLVTIYRAAAFPAKRNVFIGMVIASGFAMVGASFLLIPAFGAYGAAYASIAGPLVGILGMLWFSQHSETPVPFEWRRIATAAALAGACIGGRWLLAEVVPGVVAATAALVAFVLLLWLVRVISTADLSLLAALLPRRRQAVSLDGLSDEDRTLLDALVRRGSSPIEVATELGISETEVLARFVALLRDLSGVELQHGREREIATYLLWTGPVAERDLLAQQLWAKEVDPLATDMLARTVERLRRERRRRVSTARA